MEFLTNIYCDIFIKVFIQGLIQCNNIFTRNSFPAIYKMPPVFSSAETLWQPV